MAAKKYPDYFYENAPTWVERLENGKVVVRPRVLNNNNRAYCGSCVNLTETKKFIGEPICSLHNAAVRGHWSCPKWKMAKGEKAPHYVNIQDLGEKV